MQDDQLVTKDELLRRLEDGHATVEAVLARLSDAQMDEPNVVGAWSVKDILAHFIAHEQRALAELQHALRGERMAVDHGSGDEFNAEAVTWRHGQSPAEVRAAWEASYRQVVAAVASLSAEGFNPSGPVVAALDDTIDGALANNTYEHYTEHLSQIEAWLQAENGSDESLDLDR
jgi:hypothetical protein